MRAPRPVPDRPLRTSPPSIVAPLACRRAAHRQRRPGRAPAARAARPRLQALVHARAPSRACRSRRPACPGRSRAMRGNRSEKPDRCRVERMITSNATSTTTRRLDHPIPPLAPDRVRLEPARHLRDLGVRQAAVRLADRDQLAARRRRGPRTCSRTAPRGACRARPRRPTTTQSSVASAFFIFSQPRPRRPGEYAAVGVLDHEPLVAPRARLDERRLQRLRPSRDRGEVAEREAAALAGERQAQRLEPPAALGQRPRRAAARPVVLGPPSWSRGRATIEGDVDHRHLGRGSPPTAPCARGAPGAPGTAAPRRRVQARISPSRIPSQVRSRRALDHLRELAA